MNVPSDGPPPADNSAHAVPSRQPAPGWPIDILLVDDEPRNLDVLESILASPDYRLVRAETSDQALLALVQREFAAIVLDIRMPEMSGVELAQLIKQRKRSQHIPIIFLTAYLQDDTDVLQGYSAGGIDYLTKPINPQILKSKVSVLVDLFRTTRALVAANATLELEVAERKKAQEDLREANVALERRVQERTADLSQANHELRRSEERYRLILENALEYAIFTLDREGRVTTWSAGAQRILGFEEQEIIGRRLDVIFTQDDRENGLLDREMGRALAHHQAQDERWHVRKDGSPFWATGHMMALQGDEGQHLGFLKILRDRTIRKLAEEALRASEERFRSLILALPAAVYTTDPEGRITLCNDAAVELWGRHPEFGVDKWCGSSRIFRTDGTLLPHSDCPMAIALREGRSLRSQEIVVERADGRRAVILANPEPLRDIGGKIIGGVNMLVDISERKRAEMAVAELNNTLVSVMESIPDALFVTGAGGQIRFRNPAASRFSRAAGLDERLPAPIEADLERVMLTGEHLVPTSLKTVHRFVLDREERFFLSRILCMVAPDNRPFGAAVMLQDVTELRLLDEVKTNLISTVSHELKTPITSLRTAILLLLEPSFGSLSDSQRDMLGIARDEGERLLRTLNELLDLTRFEEGGAGMELERVPPDQLVQAAMEEMRPAAASSGVTIQAELAPSPPVVPMDRERIRHVLTNLLANAIKYSPPGGQITIRAQSESDAYRVSVLDQGPGVPPQYHSRIFEKFFRVPGTNKKGAGLGLSIAREFVRAHRGQIGVRSEPGHGSEFYFILPLE